MLWRDSVSRNGKNQLRCFVYKSKQEGCKGGKKVQYTRTSWQTGYSIRNSGRIITDLRALLKTKSHLDNVFFTHDDTWF